MNTIDDNKSNVNFGLAFRLYTNQRGVKTADLLDAKEELALYKNLSKKLKTDKFIKTELGIKSDNLRMERDDYHNKKVLKYQDSENIYAFDNSILSRNMGLRKAFGKLKAVFEGIRKNS